MSEEVAPAPGQSIFEHPIHHRYVTPPPRGTEWNPRRLIRPPALSRQAAASSPVLGVPAGWTVLPCALGARLGGAQASPGELPAGLVDQLAVAE